MNPHDLLPWDRQQAQRIILAKILLRSDGQSAHILQRGNGVGGNSQLGKFILVKWDMGHPGYTLPQPLRL
ncbi:MAG: hypothetical protein BWY71_02138 [Planctomycetes bacterium ADurb.Bin412]|nr:MAG: hypothetical protein BWY71_02138 [Planctomycetes bacterium ADurb.Bin412]